MTATGPRAEIEAAQQRAVMADARTAALDAGVPLGQLPAFLRTVDLAGNLDEGAIRERVRAALQGASEFDSRRRQLGKPAAADPPGPEDPSAGVSATLAQMQSSVGIARVEPSQSATSAQSTALDDQVAEVAASMRRSVGLG